LNRVFEQLKGFKLIATFLEIAASISCPSFDVWFENESFFKR